MSERRHIVPRFWLSDWSLSALLVLLVFDAFVLGPLAQFQAAPSFARPFVGTLFLLTGIATGLPNRAITAILGIVGLATSVARWMNQAHPGVGPDYADTALTLVFCAVLAIVILVRVFSAGRVNLHRIQGAVAAYLLFAFVWAFAYKLVLLADPDAFSFANPAMYHERAVARLLYYSTITLTTVGYGDVTPVNPVAQSLAALEGFTGQLFPAITLARLVAMEMYHRQQGGG